MQNHTNHNDAKPIQEPILFQLKSSLPFSLFLFVWRPESNTRKSLLRYLHCRRSLLFRSRRLCSKWRNLTLTNSSLCSWYFSNFVFRKYKQDSAVRVSGVLQPAKTGPPVTKNFPLFRSFLSDAMMARRIYIPCDVSCTNFAHFDRTFLTRIGQLRSRRKNPYALVQSPESVQHTLQFSRIKKGCKNFIS